MLSNGQKIIDRGWCSHSSAFVIDPALLEVQGFSWVAKNMAKALITPSVSKRKVDNDQMLLSSLMVAKRPFWAFLLAHFRQFYPLSALL